MAAYDYIRDGAEIYRRSFATIRAEADLARFSGLAEKLAVRVIHASGDVAIADRIAMSAGFADAARAALLAGRPIFCDASMVAHGITRARLPAGNEVIVTLGDPRTAALAGEIGNTRTAAAMHLWGERMAGALIVFGNAPTALFHLLEMIDDGWPRPAAVIGMPVGFVGAAEAKEALVARKDLEHVVVLGRRGGSAMAAAAVNALASEDE